MENPASMSPLRVLFSCTGIGIFNRGIESFFREAFDGLKETPGVEARLIRSEAGCRTEPAGSGEFPVWCLPRTGKLAPLIGGMSGRSAYAVEQWSSFVGVAREIRRFRPHVIFTSEANLCFLLRRFRKRIGIPFRVLFSNGGPCEPPFDRFDFVQQVAPFYYDQAVKAGEQPDKHRVVPYGIRVPVMPDCRPETKHRLRDRLGMPQDRPVILSVGWIARQHKRMDFVIEEVARMPGPRPFLQLLGNIDEHSPEIIEMGNRLLGPAGFSAKSVPYEQVADFYRAADVFVLGSLKEGFGRVYLESLMYGLPTIGHRHPVIEYVLGNVGIVADMDQPGGLARELVKVRGEECPQDWAIRRWKSVSDRFSWPAIAEDYRQMFVRAANRPLP